MQEAQSLLQSMCGDSFAWMQLLSTVGFYGSLLFCGFHFLRLSVSSLQPVNFDKAGEFCHSLMAAGMAYMFMPFMQWRVIPDPILALVFALGAAYFALRATRASVQTAAIADVFHSMMNLGMTYMFMMSVWSSELVTFALVAFYAAYATIYGGSSVWTAARLLKDGSGSPIAALLNGASHAFMAAAMVFMFMIPASMSGHDHHHMDHQMPAQTAPEQPMDHSHHDHGHMHQHGH